MLGHDDNATVGVIAVSVMPWLAHSHDTCFLFRFFAERRNWIRIPAIAYGSFVSATMVPILTELAFHKAPFYNPAVVVAFYGEFAAHVHARQTPPLLFTQPSLCV